METITTKNQISEKKFLEDFIRKLNNLGLTGKWILGDEENSMKDKKSADIVNHELGVAIEVKDDFAKSLIIPNQRFETVSYSDSLGKVSKHFKDDIKKANKKFKNYSGYETLVLVRFFHHMTSLGFSFLKNGYDVILKPENKDKNINRDAKDTSIFSFLDTRGNTLYFWENLYKDTSRKNETIRLILNKLQDDYFFKLEEI